MDRSEPALVPEWLKGASGGGVSGTTTHHHPLSALQSVSTSSPTIWQGQGMVGMPDVGRASSPGLIIATGSSQGTSVSGADGWSSALADAPVPNGGSNGLVTSVQQIVVGSSVSSIMPGPGSTSGLNMAEALVQNPARVRTPPQLSVETQRLEELALKQSRQLIPMTPSMPKTMHMEAMPAVAAFRRGSNKVTNLAAEMHVGSLGNMSSGLSSSDSETDDEVYARR